MAWKTSVLMVANVTADSDELLEAMRQLAARGPVSFLLLVPATGGGSAGREAAGRRLDSALARMRAAGLEVDGRIADQDPVVAARDAWDPAAFDEVIVSTLPTDASRWLLVDLPHRVERITGVHVHHVIASEPKPAPSATPVARREPLGVLAPLATLGWGGRGEERRQARTP